MTHYMIYKRLSGSEILEDTIRVCESPYDILNFLLSRSDVNSEQVAKLSPRAFKYAAIIPATESEWVVRAVEIREKGSPIYG